MLPSLKRLLTDTIYVAVQTGVGDAGDPTWGTPASMAARVEDNRDVIELANGERRVTTHRIYTESAILVTDRIWLPGDSSADTTLARRPIHAHPSKDPAGNVHHYETRI